MYPQFFNNDYLEFMNEIFSADNYSDLSARILKVIAKKIDADIATLWRAESEQGGMQLTLGGTYNVEFLPIEKEITYNIPDKGSKDKLIIGLPAWIAVRKMPIKIDKQRHLYDFRKPWSKSYKGKWDGTHFLDKDKFGSLIGFPLIKANDLLGVIKFERFQDKESFDDEEYQKINALIPLIVEALNSMVLREKKEQKRQRYLHDLTSTLQVPTSKTYYKDIVKLISTILSADICTLWLIKTQRLELTAHFGLNPKIFSNHEEKCYNLPKTKTILNEEIDGLTVWALIRNQPFFAKNWEKLKNHPSHRGKWDRDLWNGRPEKEFGCLYMVPLVVGNNPIGILKVERKNTFNFIPFNENERSTFEHIALMVAMAPRLRGDVNKLENSLRRLIKMVSLKDQQSLFDKIVLEASTLIGSNNCELYTLSHYGEEIALRSKTYSSNFKFKKGAERKIYRKGECLIGWVFETGKPLCLKDVRLFEDGCLLNDEELEAFSDSSEIDHEKNREIRWIMKKEKHSEFEFNQTYSFLGVPIKSEIGDALGVLIMSNPKTKLYFSKDDMQLLTDFAEIIAQVMFNDRQSRLNKVLVDIGNISKRDDLFEYAVNQMPDLVMGRGCSIFLKELKNSSQPHYLLEYTNSNYLKNGNGVIDLWYVPDKTKTGFVCSVGKTIVINYYGYGKIQRKFMQKRFSEFSTSPRYLVDYLCDENKISVGIIRLILEKEIIKKTEDELVQLENEIKTNELKLHFFEFCKANVYREQGLLSTKPCETGPDKNTKSFLAVPIVAKGEGVLGVLRITRTTDGARFSQNAIELVESITERLASVLQIERKADQIKENLKILYDINTKINSSFTKDSILDSILYMVTEKLGYEFACIQLADHDEGVIKTLKGTVNKKIKNAVDPNDWMEYEHPINVKPGERPDINVLVLMEKEDVFVIKGWHDSFNKTIYEKFGHKDLVRAWVPIIAHDPRKPDPVRIGILEAGHNIKRKNQINSHELEVLKAVANQLAIILLNWQQREELLRSKDKMFVKQLSSITEFIGHKMSNSIGAIRLMSKEYQNSLSQGKIEIQQHQLKVDFEKILEFSVEALSLPIYLKRLVEKYQDLAITDIDFETLWERVIERICKKTKSYSNIEVDINYDIPQKCDIFCDKELLYWSIEELIENAIRVLPEGGTIKIDTVQIENKYITISVKDNGIGIAPENITKVFKAGFSTRKIHDKRETHGKGLWLIKTVIEKLFDGRIYVKSEVGYGSSFMIYLPCVISSQRE
jgi:signal transduction histidine kinase